MESQRSIRLCILQACVFVVLLWIIKIADVYLLNQSLGLWGIQPRNLHGGVGILTGPLIHGSWSHISSNTLPLLLLGTLLSFGYPRSYFKATMLIWLVSGFGVWLFGRDVTHYGASGLTHGMFFYLFTAGILRRDTRSITLLMVAFFMYGGMLMTIFPAEPGISYEYHLFGAISGACCAFAFKHQDPKPVVKKYSWELEENNSDNEDTDDDLIGDEWQSDDKNSPKP